MEIQWSLVLFTLFNCLAAGMLGAVAVTAILGKAEKIQMPGLIAAFGSLVIGGFASYLHLKTPTRLFGQFANLDSGITRELIVTVVIGIVMVACYIALRNKKALSKPLAWFALVVSVVFIYVMSDSYLMAARPVWDTVFLPLYYLVQSVLFGSLGALVIAKLKAEDDSLVAILAKSALVSTGVLALVLVGYMVHIGSVMSEYTGADYISYHVGPFVGVDASSGFTRIVSGDLAVVFWLVVVVVGLAVPAAILATRNKGKNSTSLATLAGAGLVAALAGGVAFRAILYVVGSTVMKF